MKAFNVAVYIRLSVDDGDKLESNSIKNQKEMLRQYINNQDNMKLYDFYVDDGYSGTNFDRPAFQNMIQDMSDKKFDTILVKDLSRLGRNYIETGRYIEDIFPAYNIRFIAVNDNVDINKDRNNDYGNDIIVPFKNIMNDEYARDISKKTKSVLNTKVKNGEFIGSFAPYGYIKNPKDKHKLIVDPKTFKIVKKIFNMALSGKSKKSIADELNKMNIVTPSVYKIQEGLCNCKITDNMKIWTSRNVDNILKNETYTGALIQGKRKVLSHRVHKMQYINKENWVCIENHHEPLISKEDFSKVQDVYYNRDIKVKSNNKYDIFAGYLYCKECGNSMGWRRNARNDEYYYCSSHLKNKNLCNKNNIRKDKLESIVHKTINNQIDLVININDKLGKIQNEEIINYDEQILKDKILEINGAITRYTLLKTSLREDYANKIISTEDFEEFEKDYNKKLKELINKRTTTEKELKEINTPKKDGNWITKFTKKGKIEKLDKLILDELVDGIDISNSGDITIRFKYQDEYFSAINFIKNNFCDIIETSA